MVNTVYRIIAYVFAMAQGTFWSQQRTLISWNTNNDCAAGQLDAFAAVSVLLAFTMSWDVFGEVFSTHLRVERLLSLPV